MNSKNCEGSSSNIKLHVHPATRKRRFERQRYGAKILREIQSENSDTSSSDQERNDPTTYVDVSGKINNRNGSSTEEETDIEMKNQSSYYSVSGVDNIDNCDGNNLCENHSDEDKNDDEDKYEREYDDNNFFQVSNSDENVEYEHSHEYGEYDEYESDFEDCEYGHESDFEDYEDECNFNNLDDNYDENEEYDKKFSNLLKIVMFKESDITVEEVVRMIQAICIRFNLSDEARIAIIKCIKLLAGPQFELLNLNKYFISKLCKPDEGKKLYTFYCPVCYVALINPTMKKDLNRKKEVVCNQCSNNYHLTTSASNYFININVEYQLRSILCNDNMQQLVIDRVNTVKTVTNDEHISDIHDGNLFKKANDSLRTNADNYIILTANVNTDGASMFENSKYSLWSLLLVINELPPKLRFKMLLVAAVWFAEKEPNFQIMNVYINTFLKQMKSLMFEGIIVSSSLGKKVRFRLIPLQFSVDSVARPIIANRVQYNGYFGCSWCYIIGTFIKNCMKYVISKGTVINRTHAEYLIDAQNATLKAPVRGVKHLCALSQLEYFDCIWGFCAEYMHNVLLGVVRQLWDEWVKMLKPAERTAVDNKLIKIKPIKEMYRLPKILKNKGKWKAAEWLYWLLFYSILCLQEFLPKPILKSYTLFVKTMYSLLRTDISKQQLLVCENNLKKFVNDCQRIYGPEFMTFNIHILLHICESVRQSGPLCFTSAFPFESKIGQLKKNVSGPKGVVDQIANRTLEYNKFKVMLTKLQKDSPSSLFCENVFYNQQTIIKYIKSIEGAIIPSDSKSKLRNMYNRCIYNKQVLHSSLYSRPKKIDNSVVILNDNTIVRIVHFFLDKTACKVNVCTIHTEPLKLYSIQLEHIFKVVKKNSAVEYKISITSIKKKVVYVSFGDKKCDYICIPPDLYDVQ